MNILKHVHFNIIDGYAESEVMELFCKRNKLEPWCHDAHF